MGGAAALPILGGAIGAAGALGSSSANFQADSFNSYTNRVNADQALQQSAEEERQQRVHSAQVIGNERADFGASGVSSTSGSALDVLKASAANAELDALQIRNAGQRKAWAYTRGATLDSMKASYANTAGAFGAASALFGGATAAATMGGGGSDAEV